MKKLVYLLLICIIFFSCKKDDSTPSGTDATGSIQFKVNGSLILYDNVDILTGQYVVFQKQLKGGVLTETRYSLSAQKGANNVLTFQVVTDSLHETSYHYDSTFIKNTGIIFAMILNYNGQLSNLLFSSDNFDISISSYKNGRITGTFTANLTPLSSVSGVSYSQRGTTIITEGKINNVQVVY